MLLVLAAALLLSSPVLAMETVLVDWENPPLMYEDDGEAIGFYPDVVREAFRRLGTPVLIRPVPWKRVMDGVHECECGAAGLIKTKDRARALDFTVPIHKERVMVYVRRGNESLCESVASLHGKTVGAIMGWAYGEIFDAAVGAGHIVDLRSHSDATNLELLMIGRVDAFVGTKDSADSTIAASRFAGAAVSCPEPLTNNHTYIAFGKSMGKLDLIARLNAAIASMRSDGTLKRLRQRHGIDDEPCGAPAGP